MYNNDYEKDKKEIASHLGIDYDPVSNGDMKAKDAGRIGGFIGGNMVRTLIYIAEQNLQEEYEKSNQ